MLRCNFNGAIKYTLTFPTVHLQKKPILGNNTMFRVFHVLR